MVSVIWLRIGFQFLYLVYLYRYLLGREMSKRQHTLYTLVAFLPVLVVAIVAIAIGIEGWITDTIE